MILVVEMFIGRYIPFTTTDLSFTMRAVTSFVRSIGYSPYNIVSYWNLFL